MTSRFGFAALVTLLATGLAGCPTETTGTDAGMTAMPDAHVQEDAPSMAMEDAPSMAMEDAPSMAMEDAPSMMMADSPAAMSATWADVHDELSMRCGSCHTTGRSGGHSMGQTDVAMAYADSQLAAAACAGVTKGACAAMRVRAGTMPPGGISDMAAREALADLMDSWVAGGQVGP
jgi:uncharacterized membrane protein